MNRRDFLKFSGLSLFSFGVPCRATSAPVPERKPNIILFLTDDMGYGDPCCYGGSFAPTPNIDRIAREGIARGVPIGEAFKKEAIFPQVVVNLIAIGEKSGHVEEILMTLSGFYEKEIDEALKNFVAFLEPALLVIIGIIVAGIAFSVIMPIYQLVSQYS